MTERLFSTYQIAKLLGATLGSVAQWMDKGDLNFCRMPDGSAQITESDLIKFLTEQGIDLGEVLAKAGYTKVAATDAEDSSPTQPVSDETDDAITETTTSLTTNDAITNESEQHQSDQDEADDDETDSDEAEQDEAEQDEADGDETDRTDDQPHPLETAPSDKSPRETTPEQPLETARPELRAEDICDEILTEAAAQNAQTIHLTPRPDNLLLQLRTNGRLHDKLNCNRHIPDTMTPQIIACLLQRANPDIDPENLPGPLNAEFSHSIDGRDVRLRVSALPTVHGTRLVIHMPRQTADIESFDLEDTARTQLEKLLQADGLILVAAKRRTGRDTILQTLLNAADTDRRIAIAIEQSPAPDIDNVVRLQIDPASGLSYAEAITGIEHQDADAIVITELRDPTTALKAFDLAHDGALVIAGINANSASAAISEMLTMGVEPWPLGGTLKAVVERIPLADRTMTTRVIFIEGRLSEIIRGG